MSATDLARIENKIADRITPQATSKMMVGSTGLAIQDMNQLLEFAKIMAIGGVSVPKFLRGSPGACIAVCLQAIEWQMSPFAVANKSYSVNDRLAYEAQLIHAVLLKRAPIKGRPKFEFLDDGAKRRCRVSAVLSEDGSTCDYVSPPIGEIPIKNSPLWKADPDQQLGYYSVRALARRHFPDVILGVLEREELRYNAIEGDYAEERPPEQAQAPAKPSVNQRLAELGSMEQEHLADDDEIDPDTGEIITGRIVDDGAAPQDDVPPDDGTTLAPAPEKAASAPRGRAARASQTVDVPADLLAAARKGKKPLALALGKLSTEEYTSMSEEQMAYLDNVAAMSNMKTGE